MNRRQSMHGMGNALKTALLLGSLSALILLAGQVLGGTTGLLLAGLLALGINGVSYFYSDKLALRAMRAERVTPEQAPRLHATIAELVSRRGLPMPRVYISPSSTPNAFATGRSPSHAAVCVTTGILDVLDERELRGVLGHEISHVSNRDILIASVAAGLASMIMILVNVAQLGAVFGFGGNEEDSGARFLEILLIALLGPLAAGLIQAAISRSREYAADTSGAEVTGDPIALADALAKIERAVQTRPLQPTANTAPVSALMIVNPFSGRTSCGCSPPIPTPGTASHVCAPWFPVTGCDQLRIARLPGAGSCAIRRTRSVRGICGPRASKAVLTTHGFGLINLSPRSRRVRRSGTLRPNRVPAAPIAGADRSL
jgi:heat shock protein HtpX